VAPPSGQMLSSTTASEAGHCLFRNGEALVQDGRSDEYFSFLLFFISPDLKICNNKLYFYQF